MEEKSLDNEFCAESVDAGDKLDQIKKVEEPKVGMHFNTYEELVMYYESYASQEGFAVFQRSTSTSDDGQKRYRTLSCSREGSKSSRSKNEFCLKPNARINCKAKLNVIIGADGKCVVSKINLEHNHSLSPNKSRFFRSNRVMGSHIKKKLEMNDIAGIRPNKSYRSIVVEAGGPENVPFLEKDCRNFLDKVRRLRLGEGDAAAINKYFLKMQADNSKFFYVMDLDEKGRLKNIFWADAKSRAAYEEFGDVITFDTTYLTNKYDMPFAPFVGVNHHGQSILLGCGLISKEDTDTFKWLFKSWLTCMSDRAPSAVITDQDKAMQNAIAEIFPQARHRWCLWHILKKLPEKLKAYKEYDSIKFTLKNAVYNSLSHHEFEESWSEMIEKYELQSNDWLASLYDERARWVPVYVKDCFWAGMSTTQRSESINSFFDGYVNSKTTLKQFVEQYENALASKVSKENQEDFNSYSSMYPCITDYEMEKELQSFYTNTKFKEFQQELKRKLYCEVSQSKSDCSKFSVVEDCKFGEKRRHVSYKVELDEKNLEVACNCRLFEFRGILCRHAISVLIHKKIYHLPLRYVLHRWRKDVKRCHTRVTISYNAMSVKVEAKRFEKMCNAFHEVADLAAEEESKCDSVMGWITSLKGVLKGENDQVDHDSTPFSTENYPVSPKENNNETAEISKICSPLIVRGKGRPPTKRIKSTVERVVKKKQNSKKMMEGKAVNNHLTRAVDDSRSKSKTPEKVLNTQTMNQATLLYRTPQQVPNAHHLNQATLQEAANENDYQYQTPQQVLNTHQVNEATQQIRPMLLDTCLPYMHDQATTFDPYNMSRQGQPYYSSQQHLNATLRAPQTDGYVTPGHYHTLSAENTYGMSNDIIGTPAPLPHSHIQQINNSQNQLLPSPKDVIVYPAESTKRHPHSELLNKFFSMGYKGDQVLSVIQSLEESGRRVDYNAVLDRLNDSLSYFRPSSRA